MGSPEGKSRMKRPRWRRSTKGRPEAAESTPDQDRKARMERRKERERAELKRTEARERTKKRQRSKDQGGTVGNALLTGLGEVLAIGREMFRIPAGLYM